MMAANLRPLLAQHLQQRLQAFTEGFRHNLALIGPPGSGKTFQLEQLLRPAPAGLTVIYCRLYRESSRSFLTRLLSTILETAAGPPEGREPQAVSTLMRTLEETAPRLAAGARAVEPLLLRRLYGEAFNRTLDLIPLLIELKRQPCVLVLDEFLALEELGLAHAFHELGKRVMTWPSTLFILASSSPHRARVILRERLQLLFGQFELLTLDMLDPATAGPWMQQELRGLRGAKHHVPFFWHWLGGHPWYLAVLMKRLREVAAVQRTLELNDAVLRQAMWDVLGSPEGTLAQWCAGRCEQLARTRSGARAVEVLLSLAEGARTATEVARRCGRSGVAPALQFLLEHDLVSRKGTCWMITDPVLRGWLTVVLSQQRRAPGTGEDDAARRERFDRYLQGLWQQWVQTTALSFPDQVTRLLSQFRDDTLSIDSKTGRLPAFRSVTSRPSPDGRGAYLIADGPGRWCCAVFEGRVAEDAVAGFDAFCRTQQPRPARKVLIVRAPLEPNTRLIAKAANIWVWEPEDLRLLMELYRPAAPSGPPAAPRRTARSRAHAGA